MRENGEKTLAVNANVVKLFQKMAKNEQMQMQEK